MPFSSRDADPFDMSWLRSDLTRRFGRGVLWIPPHYGAYFKLLHPAQAKNDLRDVSWSEIADSARLPLTISTRLLDLCLDAGNRDKLALPPHGIMSDVTCSQLVNILAKFTKTPHACLTVFSTSWGDLLPRDHDLRPAFLWGETVLLSLIDIREICNLSVSPTLLWPADRAWIVATLLDTNWSVIGCSQEAGEVIRRARDLDVLTLEPDELTKVLG
jgi:hypothetical protein